MAQPAPAHGEDSAAEGIDEEEPPACTWVSRVELRQQELRRLFDLPLNEVRARGPPPARAGPRKSSWPRFADTWWRRAAGVRPVQLRVPAARPAPPGAAVHL